MFKKNFIILFATSFSWIFFNNFAEATFLNNSYKEVIDHVWQIVYRDFLDSSGKFQKSNWIKLRKELLSKTYSDSEEAYNSIRKMLSDLDDPYTRFLDPKEFNQMRIDTSGELTGVGIQIVKDKESDDLIIISPIKDTPAYKAGIKARDKILSIDDISTEGMSIEDAVKLIRGKRGTQVKLEILRDGDSFYQFLSREKIEIKSVSSKINKTQNGLFIGYLKIKQFNANASKELRDSIKDYETIIETSDEIISIDDNPIENLNLEDALNLLRGQKGTKVKMEILREGQRFFKFLSREMIDLELASQMLSKSEGGFLKGLKSKYLSGYILDLRSNPGGLLESSIDISRYFINKGVIVSTLNKDGLKQTKRGNGQALTKKPLIVLVNKSSASASEIVSGAIKDNKRGKLVGEKTFGKGLVQSMRTLVDGSGLTVTVAKYLTPNGTDINKSGIVPDIEVKMNINPNLQREFGTRKDKQYQVGEKELINIIKIQNQIKQFNPASTNLNALLEINKENKVFSLN